MPALLLENIFPMPPNPITVSSQIRLDGIVGGASARLKLPGSSASADTARLKCRVHFDRVKAPPKTAPDDSVQLHLVGTQITLRHLFPIL